MNTVFDHQDSLDPQQAFIAFFDVLGFQARLRHSGLSEVLAAYRNLAETKIRSGTLPVFSRAGVTHHQVGSAIFSDCIIFWCNDDWEAVQSLVSASAHMIAAAIDMGWPLRGGLAYGECVLDRDTRTFIGQPIIDAYNTERSQKWIGAGLHQSVLGHSTLGEKIGRLEDVIEYDVPIKKGQPVLSHAVHWCPYSSRARTSIDEMKRNIEERKAKRYYDLTLAYITGRCKEYRASG